ncbi:MAG: Fic family protein [Pyrinomonadaceae bacterium]
MIEMTKTKSLPRPIGLAAVIEELQLQIPLPAVRSTVVAGARKTRVESNAVYEQYPKTYAATGLFENLKFAMRYEPVDLGVLRATFEKIAPEIIAEWVRGESTGIYARRIWYLYELLTGQILDVPDVPPTGYVDLLSPKLQFTGKPTQVRRQRINNNLLGNRDYCPLIRRTDVLEHFIAEGLDKEAKAIVEETDPVILARAVNYLYTRETKSSFAIEGETPGKNRSERFIAALAHAADFNVSDKTYFIALQNQIVDPRFTAKDWRSLQNFVGQTMRDYSEQVHFVCPKPEDVPNLMEGWMRFVERLQSSNVDAVAAAAAMSFGFVFIHPFEDGNGRIHRFLIHHELARSGFAPQKLVFPVSAVMLRERADYDRVLESYSKAILEFVEYRLDERGEMTVENKTAHLYRYWDATRFAEFLYRTVSETIRRDLREELGFLNIFDRAMKAVMEIIDMPDRRASLLIRLILQNRGELSKNKRTGEFAELTDDEIVRIEAAIRELEPS